MQTATTTIITTTTTILTTVGVREELEEEEEEEGEERLVGIVGTGVVAEGRVGGVRSVVVEVVPGGVVLELTGKII